MEYKEKPLTCENAHWNSLVIQYNLADIEIKEIKQRQRRILKELKALEESDA